MAQNAGRAIQDNQPIKVGELLFEIDPTDYNALDQGKEGSQSCNHAYPLFHPARLAYQ
jgi:hypothetical protein